MHQRTRARGFTLVELLVVVLILLLLTGITIPIVAPALQGRHIREASRQVNSFFAVARDTALRNRRPVGVMIHRFESKDQTGATVGTPLTEMSVLLTQVEVPPPYSGDFATSRATIDPTLADPMIGSIGGISDLSLGADVGWLGLIRAGDMIQFNYQGKYYMLGGLGAGSPIPSGDPIPLGQPLEGFPWLLFPLDSATVSPWPAAPAPLPFNIVRQPVPTAAQPLQLTGTVIIDLNWSSDDNGFFVARDLSSPPAMPPSKATYPPSTTLEYDVRPIVIMFAPNGSLERVYRSRWSDPDGPGGNDPIWNWTNQRPSGPIHLLIGQRDAVPANSTMDPTEQESNNWRNLENLWVSIHPQTGLITTTENVEVLDPLQQADPYLGMRTARQYAIRAQSMGGR